MNSAHDLLFDHVKPSDFVPTDEELSGIQASMTENKNAKEKELQRSIRRIMARVGNRFGPNSGQYRRFGSEGLTRMDAAELYQCGKRVLRQPTTLLELLASEGLAQSHLTDLEAKNRAFDQAMDEQDDAIRDRDIAVEDRITVGNELYGELVRLSNSGKSIWVDENEAKHNDYNLTKSRTGNTSMADPDAENYGLIPEETDL